MGSKGLTIILSKTVGFCYGVKNAIKIVEKSLLKYPHPIYTLGPLIHNKSEVKRLQNLGIKHIDKLEKIKSGSIITRTHGIEKNIMEILKSKKLNVINGTCPFIKKIQNIVSVLSKKKYFIFILGDKNHPEIKSVVSYIKPGNNFLIIDVSKENIDFKKYYRIFNMLKKHKIAVVSQTTIPFEKFDKITKELNNIFKNIKIYNTICASSIRRQKEALELAKNVEVIIVIGGKHSANTKHLFELSKTTGVKAYHIEQENEIDNINLSNIKKLGIITGASTPDWLIKNIVNKLKKLKK